MSWEARGEIIRQFILEHAEEFPKDLTKKTQEHFGISRQAVNLHVRKLVESGLLTVTGSTRARRYALRVVTDESFALPLSLSLQESYVWDVWVKPQLGTLPDNVVNIWHHGVTEMVNNAIDHSGGDKLVIRIIRTAVTSSMMINDNGEGIFHKIQREFGLYDPRHAILELAKGKLTTDPAHHSGEGIFFTSRAFDEFTILSGGLYFSHTAQHDADWLINGGTDDRGTMVVLKLYILHAALDETFF
jgi:anti-sigma regulatory factor (Ser/Thr protein kinase)